jgi:hypothetical protein
MASQTADRPAVHEDGTHLCHAAGCARYVLRDHIMCRQHWQLIPLPLQGLLNRLRPANGDAASRRYVALVRQAIAVVSDA